MNKMNNKEKKKEKQNQNKNSDFYKFSHCSVQTKSSVPLKSFKSARNGVEDQCKWVPSCWLLADSDCCVPCLKIYRQIKILLLVLLFSPSLRVLCWVFWILFLSLKIPLWTGICNFELPRISTIFQVASHYLNRQALLSGFFEWG